MIPNLEEIKRTRKKLNLNQKELAEKAGVSQSLITKIEAHKLEPTFTKAQRIFETLTKLEQKEQAQAKDLMNKKIIFAKPKDKIKTIIKIMKNKGISQLPVLKQNQVCGLISEKVILDHLSSNPNLAELTAQEIMADSPPIISLDTSQRVILEILKEHQLILVSHQGLIQGIISKSDVLKKI